MERISDVVIIGAGPAGMSAAIYASRAGLKTYILESGAPGGKLTKTDVIDNFPGVQAVSGFDLANQMFTHATSFGAEYVYGNVVHIDAAQEDGFHHVICNDGMVFKTKAVIIASGTQEKLLHIPGEAENVGRGVSFCAVCDGAFFKNKAVAVVGGGNAALEEALYLTQFVSKVYLIIRRDVFRADQVLIDKVEHNDKFEIIREHAVTQVMDDGIKVVGVKIKGKDDKEQELPVSALFPYIGALPLTGFLKGLNILDKRGYILVNNQMETAIKGIYAAGDVVQKQLRQVVTATSDGAIAAQSCVHQIKGI